MAKKMKLTKEVFNPDNLTAEDVLAFRLRYKDDPVLFAKEILLIKPDANQRAILNTLRDNPLVAVSSGRGIGKTWVIGIASLWFMTTRPGAKILALANTAQQSASVLWPPLCTMLSKSLISEWFEYSTEMIYFKGDRDSSFIKRVTWSENSIESVSGFHSTHLLYVLDEASKMPSSLIENLYASCTETDNRMLLTSNPTRNSGYFFDVFSDSMYWKTICIDSRNSDHTDKNKIAELVDKYGEDSDVVRVQVRGLFPLVSSSTIISTSLLNESFNKASDLRATDSVSIGVDIGGGSDPTCWVVRKGRVIVELRKEYTEEDEKIMSVTQSLAEKHGAMRIQIDSTGVGHFIPGRLRKYLPPQVVITGINFSEKSPDPDCANMRAFMYRRIRDWMTAGGSISGHHAIRDQLQATEYFYDKNGKIQLRPKTDIVEAVGHSPDEADALALSVGYTGDLNDINFNAKAINKGSLAKLMMSKSGW